MPNIPPAIIPVRIMNTDIMSILSLFVSNVFIRPILMELFGLL